MPGRSRWLLVAVPVAVLLGAGGCSESPGGPVAFELLIRDEAPYIEGQVVTRLTDDRGSLRILVQSSQPDARTPAAVVTVRDNATLLWPDGRAAPSSALLIPRGVKVWTTGVELRSLPPQVQARVIVLLDDVRTLQR